MWRSQVACWFWVPKVEGSNPSTPRRPMVETEKTMECRLTVGQLLLVQCGEGSNPFTPRKGNRKDDGRESNCKESGLSK